MEKIREFIDSEDKARKFLTRQCWQKQRRFCPRCQKFYPYRLSDGRLRCRACGYTFHDFSGRWINRGNLSSRQWLQLIGMFEAETSTRQIAARLNLSYNTAYRAITTIRLTIIAHSPSAHLWLDLENELLAQLAEDDLVFGIRQLDLGVDIVPVPGLTSRELLAGHLRMVRRGHVVFTGPYDEYKSLVFFLRGDNCHRFSRTGVPQGRTDFWHFLKDRINKKITCSKFPLFLKEIEFRYNHRDRDLKAPLIGMLCEFEKTHLNPGNEIKELEEPESEKVLLLENRGPLPVAEGRIAVGANSR